jgi:DNA-binding transcriptional ArsR family regulator
MRSKAALFDTDLARLAEQAKALSHPARLAILTFLARQESCVCGDVVDEIPLAQATVSRHLKVLKDAGLIQGEVDGPRVCYCIDREAMRSLRVELGEFFDELALDQPVTCC